MSVFGLLCVLVPKWQHLSFELDQADGLKTSEPDIAQWVVSSLKCAALKVRQENIFVKTQTIYKKAG